MPIQMKSLEAWRVRNQWRIRELRFTMHVFWRSPLSVAGLILVSFIFAISLLAPYLATHPPLAIDLDSTFQNPSWKHYFGTDNLGMDIYSRVLYAGLYDLSIGAIVLVVCTLIGTLVGIVSGYSGGKIDELLMRVSDIFLACPGLILAMAASAALQSTSLYVLVFAISLGRWPTYARLVRGQALSVRENPYVEAARSIGASSWHILIKHVLPNIMSPVIIRGTLDIGAIILMAATLGFVGLGAPPGNPEWGRMVADGRVYLESHPWIILWPGMMILLTVLGFNLLGDGLRDVMDPKWRSAQS
jgi:peptide/nickel transport system permease protein